MADRTAAGNEHELSIHRERIAWTLLISLVALGSVAYVPSVWVGVRVGAWGVVVLDTLVYLALLVVTVCCRNRPRIQAVSLVALTYLLALGLAVALGPNGAGPLWLAAVPVGTALLFDRRATWLSLGLVTVTGLGLFGVAAAGWLHWSAPVPSPLLWLVLVVNALLLAAALGLATAALIQGLRRGSRRIAQVSHELQQEQERLRQSNVRLQREISERREAEARLRQAEKMQAVGTLASGIAHDFNNLLTPILSATEMLREEEGEDSQRAQLLDRARDAALGGRDLVRRILAFSKPSAEGREPTELRRLVDEALRLLRASLPGAVSLETHLADASGAVRLSMTDAQQILLNLGSNAYRAMPDGGTITLLVDTVPAPEAGCPDAHARPERVVRIAFSDTGTGMEPDVARRVFEPFFTTDLERGTGIGLATVHGIVTGAGGHIACHSEPGHGTTFEILLPRLNVVPRSAPVRPAAAATAGAGERILVVDDEEAVREVAARVLERQGYSVSRAQGYAAAVALLDRSGPFDAVLTDLNMPGANGLRLAGEVRARAPGTAIVLMSGLVDDALRLRAWELGIAGLIAKPFQVGELGAALSTALRTPTDAEGGGVGAAAIDADHPPAP